MPLNTYIYFIYQYTRNYNCITGLESSATTKWDIWFYKSILSIIHSNKKENKKNLKNQKTIKDKDKKTPSS